MFVMSSIQQWCHTIDFLTFTQIPKYCVGDKVYLLGAGGAREGPYIVSSVSGKRPCSYRLENSSGESVGNGTKYKEEDLTQA